MPLSAFLYFLVSYEPKVTIGFIFGPKQAQLNIILKDVKNRWTSLSNIHVSGFVFYEGKLLQREALAILFQDIDSSNQLQKLLSELNGQFAVMGEVKGRAFAVVDHVRSIPVFFSPIEGFFITDHLGFDDDVTSQSPYLEKHVFHSIEHTFGNDTLCRNVKALQAGQFLWFENGKSEVKQHFSHLKSMDGSFSLKEGKEKFKGVLDGVITGLLEFADGRKICIPLSAGYDSRIILAGLLKHGYQNIQTFTYGRIEGFEARVAKDITAKLNVPWEGIPYTSEVFAGFFDKDFDQFCEYASNLVAVPQEQDYFALRILSDRDWAREAVFTPGYYGDFYAGSYVPDAFFERKWKKKPISVVQQVLQKNFRKPNDITQADLAFFTGLKNELDDKYEQFQGRYEEWAVLEKNTKYVVNGLRTYEHFGFDWYLPLVDKEILAFYHHVPLVYRQNRELYNQAVEEHFFAPLNILDQANTFDSKFQYSGPRSWMRHYLPPALKTLLKKVVRSSAEGDINQLDEFGDMIAEKLGESKGKPVNEMMGKWLVHLLNR